VCWERSIETLNARKDQVSGLAVASDERIEACILYIRNAEILSLRTLIEDEGAHLKHLLSHLGPGTFPFTKVHPAEISPALLLMLGFRVNGLHRLYATAARSN
jgi:hypothetical protein